MLVKKIKLENFRNYESLELEFSLVSLGRELKIGREDSCSLGKEMLAEVVELEEIARELLQPLVKEIKSKPMRKKRFFCIPYFTINIIVLSFNFSDYSHNEMQSKKQSLKIKRYKYVIL